jgi:hypothetical protein
MRICERLNKCQRLLNAARARLHFYSHYTPANIGAIFAWFHNPHPPAPMIKNKTWGIALIDLSNFKGAEDYIATVKKRDFACLVIKQ